MSATNVKNQMRLFAGTQTVSGGSAYTNLLDQTGGNAVQVSITKIAGTDLVAIGYAALIAPGGVNETGLIGVNDGTTDYDLARQRVFASSTPDIAVAGAKLISGLGAGAYTMSLRLKPSGANSIGHSANGSAYLTVMEITAGANVQVNSVVFGSTFSTSSSSYVDLLDGGGGSAISISITKAAGTNLHVRGFAHCVGNGGTLDTVSLGCHDGSSDHDMHEARFQNSFTTTLIGEALLTGLGAGTHTIKLRTKTGGQQVNYTVNQSAAIVVEEVPA